MPILKANLASHSFIFRKKLKTLEVLAYRTWFGCVLERNGVHTCAFFLGLHSGDVKLMSQSGAKSVKTALQREKSEWVENGVGL